MVSLRRHRLHGVRVEQERAPPFSIASSRFAAVMLLMPAELLTARLGARVAHSASKRRSRSRSRLLVL